jgi:predicted RNase H-like HicB family nuclease
MDDKVVVKAERSRPMGLIVVRATWDQEASVWVAESPDLPGLVTEAPSLDALDAKLAGLILDLVDDDDNSDLDIPVEVIASFSRRVRGRARAA